MNAVEVANHLNETPYYFSNPGVGGLRCEVEGKTFWVARNKSKGGLDVRGENGVLHFVWDSKSQKWRFV